MPVHDAQYFAFLREGSIMPTGSVLYASGGGAGDVVLGTPVPGAVYQVTATVAAWLHVGGPATANADFYLAAGMPVSLVLCNEDIVAPNIPIVHVYLTAAGAVSAAQMSLPNLVARFTGLGASEAAAASDSSAGSGGHQLGTLAEGQASADSTTMAKVPT